MDQDETAMLGTPGPLFDTSATPVVKKIQHAYVPNTLISTSICYPKPRFRPFEIPLCISSKTTPPPGIPNAAHHSRSEG